MGKVKNNHPQLMERTRARSAATRINRLDRGIPISGVTTGIAQLAQKLFR
jgi:hypothetical protein